MKPIRPASLADAVPFQRGAGHRTPATLLLIDERNRYLIEAARFYTGASDREAARLIRTALSTYQTGRWRRDRVEATCPVQHKGKLTAVFWMLLKVRDAIPSKPTIRRALGSIREPQDGMM